MVAVSYLVHYDSLLQNTTDIITKYHSYFITKCNKSLPENAAGPLLQNATVLLENATILLQSAPVVTRSVGTIIKARRCKRENAVKSL